MFGKRSGSDTAEMLVVAEDLGRFEGLEPELDAEFPEGGWTRVSEAQLRKALDQAAPAHVLITADRADPAHLTELGELISLARNRGASVVLVVQDLPASEVHRLMRAGADDFLPVPVPKGELRDSLERIARRSTPSSGAPAKSRQGLIYPVYGVAGGVGASTFAVNLAWDLAQEGRKKDVRVCLLDLDLQYGSAATYLDLERGEAVFELLSDLENADAAGFHDALAERTRNLS
ncbi:MAG: AAA family ATPase, partial [Pseudomonadota bacterium]